MVELCSGIPPMENDDYLGDVHVRILRVSEDLRKIQRTLNFAAMEAPSNPELMENLNRLPEMESLQILRSALDQMRHFLWFYVQIMTNESESGEHLRQLIRQRISEDTSFSTENSILEKYKQTTDTVLLRHFSDAKNRKPN